MDQKDLRECWIRIIKSMPKFVKCSPAAFRDLAIAMGLRLLGIKMLCDLQIICIKEKINGQIIDKPLDYGFFEIWTRLIAYKFTIPSILCSESLPDNSIFMKIIVICQALPMNPNKIQNWNIELEKSHNLSNITQDNHIDNLILQIPSLNARFFMWPPFGIEALQYELPDNTHNKEKITKWVNQIYQFGQIHLNFELWKDLGDICQSLRENVHLIKKDLGAFYTPLPIVDYLIRRTFFLSSIKWIRANTLHSNSEEIKEYTPESCLKILQLDLQINSSTSRLKNLIDHWKVMSICDPSCGTGDFLIYAVQQWLKWFLIFQSALNKSTNTGFEVKTITEFIIPRIYGWDIDPLGLNTSQFRIAFVILAKIFTDNLSYTAVDILIQKWGEISNQISLINPLLQKLPIDLPKMDLIIGNPPYINLIEDPNQRYILEQYYPSIYHGKLDLSYYFLPCCLDLMDEQGYLAFVLKRYFLKSPTTYKLRKWIQSNASVIELVDFGNLTPFSQTGIQILLGIFKKKSENISEMTRYILISNNNIQEIGLEGQFQTILNVNLATMADRWLIDSSFGLNKFPKTLLMYNFKDYVDTNVLSSQNFQLWRDLSKKTLNIPLFKLVKGIQTGKDEVFIVDSKTAQNFELEGIRPFIKGQHIKSYGIIPTNLYVINSHRYSPIVGKIGEKSSQYPNIEVYLRSKQPELSNRSRALGSQWAFWRQGDERQTVDFSKPKLVWPYRGKEFRAAIDFSGAYHSQDVILLTLNWKEMAKCLSIPQIQQVCDSWSEFGIYFYCALFNSGVFHRYLFDYAKEFAKDTKDFQPNNFSVINLPLWQPNLEVHQQIAKIGKDLTNKFQNWLTNQQNQEDWEVPITILAILNEIVQNLF